MAESDNKRRIDRIRLYAPILASVENQRITVIDVSEIGARVEHSFPLATGSTIQILFIHNEIEVGVDCEVVRCKLDKSVVGASASYTSGLRFLSPDDPTVGILLEMLHNVVREDLPARRKIAAKKRPPSKKVLRAKSKK